MSVTLVNSWPLGDQREYLGRQAVTAEKMRDLARATTYLRNYSTWPVAGQIYSAPKALREGSEIQNSIVPLMLHPEVRLSSQAEYLQFRLAAQGNAFQVTIELYNSITGAAIVNPLVATAGAGYIQTNFNVARSAVVDGSGEPAPVRCRVLAQAYNGDPSGTLIGWQIYTPNTWNVVYMDQQHGL